MNRYIDMTIEQFREMMPDLAAAFPVNLIPLQIKDFYVRVWVDRAQLIEIAADRQHLTPLQYNTPSGK
ncbi:MAG: hypothetical protein ILA17_09525 [Ruminococcus sp.]|nr:hypothetical protein [Ruminococcus sp.]